jgi:hypothetical protein
MVRTLAELDYSPLFVLGLKLPMSTLTYPGDWLTVAPEGAAVKAHMRALWERFARAWGFPWLGVWKLEFQRRGAPHVHLFGPEPEGLAGSLRAMTSVRSRPALGDGLPYAEWLGMVWADIVDHPDGIEWARHARAGTAVDLNEGARMIDPKRLAVYFTKHGSFAAKEYQNCVPDAWAVPGKSAGRFWGYRGLARGVAEVELSPGDAVQLARLLRRYSRSQRVTAARVVRRIDLATGVVHTRSARRRVVRVPRLAGFLCVNDGPALAGDLARALAVASSSRRPTPVNHRHSDPIPR